MEERRIPREVVANLKKRRLDEPIMIHFIIEVVKSYQHPPVKVERGLVITVCVMCVVVCRLFLLLFSAQKDSFMCNLEVKVRTKS